MDTICPRVKRQKDKVIHQQVNINFVETNEELKEMQKYDFQWMPVLPHIYYTYRDIRPDILRFWISLYRVSVVLSYFSEPTRLF